MTGPAATNYAGKKHGAWRILRRNYDRARGTYWNAMCACHRRGVLFAGDIARGRAGGKPERVGRRGGADPCAGRRRLNRYAGGASTLSR